MFNLGLSIVVAGVLATAAHGQEVTGEKKAESKPFVNAYSQVQLRLFNNVSKDADGALSDATTFQRLRPMLGAVLFDGVVDTSIRTNIDKQANSAEVTQKQAIFNVTINNIAFGPLSITPYVEHYLPGAGKAAFTEAYLDNIVSTKLSTGFGEIALAGEVELLSVLHTDKQQADVKDERVALGLVKAEDAVKKTDATDATFQHEWNLGATVSPTVVKGLSVGLQQYLTNSYVPVYTVDANGDQSTDAGFPLTQASWERMTVTYKVNDRFTVQNLTDLYQTGVYAAAGTADAIQNQTRLIVTLF